ncbi:MAG TPA: AraC family transcriptional regulator [Gemmatimonadaceae bacterium]|nr:AraC family transcriptional regulator [Gemmatimonadaceae bacterium]
MTLDNARPSWLLARSSGPSLAQADAAEEVDVLSDVLRAVRLSAALFFVTDASSPWAIQVPPGTTLAPLVMPGAQNLISYHVVASGRCWCRVAGAVPVRLDVGDVIVIPHGHSYALSLGPEIVRPWPPEDVLDFFRMMAAGSLPFTVTEGGGGPDRLQLVCGFLGCDAGPFNPVLGTLPPALRVGCVNSDHDDRLAHLIRFAMAESSEPRSGSACVRQRIAELMFVEVVRRHLSNLAPGHGGWLAGLRDPVVGRALELLHRHADQPWTIGTLAREAATSRSALAERFVQLVGIPPMQYLARWRMQLATRLLADGNAKVAAIAARVGYESEAAFSRAFTRVVGMPPAAWRRQRAR